MRKYFSIFVLILIFFFVSCEETESIQDDQTQEKIYKIIYGYVYTAEDFTPLKKVHVKEEKSEKSSLTNDNGYYELKISKPSYSNFTIDFTKNEFEAEKLKIKDNGNKRQRVDIFMIPKLNGNTYYVSTDGKNSNDGSENSPWRTPGYASRRLNPGDTLIIKKGTYIIKEYDVDIIMPEGGAKGNWILIKGEEGTKLLGSNNISTVINLSNSSFVKVENIEITNNNSLVRDGIEILGDSNNNILIKNIKIHHIDEFGINSKDVEYMVVEYSEISYCGFGGFGGPHGDFGGIRNLKIFSSIFSYSGHYYQGGDGSSRPYDRPDGFGIEESDGPIEIYDSLFSHNYGDGIDSKAKNTYIHHSIVSNNSCDGVKLWRGNSKIENTLIYGTGDGVGGDSPWAGIVIECNKDGDKFEINGVTLHDNEERKAYPLYVQYDSDKKIKVIIRNSIFAGGYGHLFFGDSVDLTFEYNLTYIPSRDDQVYANGRLYSKDDIKNGLLGEGNKYGDPQFINPAWGEVGDYHLKSKSPAIDSGINKNNLIDDLEHNKRPEGKNTDMGAYEKTKDSD